MPKVTRTGQQQRFTTSTRRWIRWRNLRPEHLGDHAHPHHYQPGAIPAHYDLTPSGLRPPRSGSKPMEIQHRYVLPEPKTSASRGYPAAPGPSTVPATGTRRPSPSRAADTPRISSPKEKSALPPWARQNMREMTKPTGTLVFHNVGNLSMEVSHDG